MAAVRLTAVQVKVRHNLLHRACTGDHNISQGTEKEKLQLSKQRLKSDPGPQMGLHTKTGVERAGLVTYKQTNKCIEGPVIATGSHFQRQVILL